MNSTLANATLFQTASGFSDFVSVAVGVFAVLGTFLMAVATMKAANRTAQMAEETKKSNQLSIQSLQPQFIVSCSESKISSVYLKSYEYYLTNKGSGSASDLKINLSPLSPILLKKMESIMSPNLTPGSNILLFQENHYYDSLPRSFHVRTAQNVSISVEYKDFTGTSHKEELVFVLQAQI